MTSPLPNPSWSTVAAQLAKRLPNFAGTIEDDDGNTTNDTDLISTRTIDISTLQPSDLTNVDGKGNPADIVMALGINTPQEEARFQKALDYFATINKQGDNGTTSSIIPYPAAVLIDPSSSPQTLKLRSAGPYRVFYPAKAMNDAISTLTPFGPLAAGKRLLAKTETLLARKSSEDYIFAILFCIHGLVTDVDVVKSDINPSWEKGVVRNVKEFKKMADCCLPEIQAAFGDPQTKEAIDLLNAVDLRDQVGSYRIIVSNETPQLEEFTSCILQKNDCFNCDAPILEKPRVPLLSEWRGEPLDDRAARDIMMGHLDHPSAHSCSMKKPWSWKIVVGANPAYDAFPMQHQIFYPCNENPEDGSSTSKSLWYDPVFCVETLANELVWCKRHYRCTPRTHYSGVKPGAWTFVTQDNGMVSEERWTTVDAADDLSWTVLHYSGAAKKAGQSYVGALLCTADGLWPEGARKEGGEGLERIRKAFRKCDLELWELFGGSTEESFMWGEGFREWKEKNPPDLERIGDISISAWRKQEREKAMEEAATARV